MTILAIETSCDETSICIFKDKKVKSNIIYSQIAKHNEYGGIVPEIASRLHTNNIGYVLKEAIKKSNTKIENIDYIAYTEKPGLSGALHIGKTCAQTLSLMLKKPLLPCHHIQGHIYSSAIDNEFQFPLLALVVSGGHTQIVLMKEHLDFKVLGETLDDAVGESYDKVARALGLEYPGGPIIDKLSKNGKHIFELPLPKNDKTLDFSFSGLKVAVINLINKLKTRNLEFKIEDILYSFQIQAITILIKKLQIAIEKYKPKMITIVGGVSANSLLRKKIKEIKTDAKIIIPDLKYCTDNAAMIARLTWQKINNELIKQNKKDKKK